MGLFGGGNKKEFVSNGKIFEYVTTVGNYSKLEDELEKRYLYRNIEDIQYLPNATAIVRYKDLKVLNLASDCLLSFLFLFLLL